MNGYLDPNGNTETFQIVLAFTLGVALSPFSRGILFLIIFALVFELYYSYQSNFDYCYRASLLRCGLFLYSFVGFLVGRAFCCNDWDPIRGIYAEDENFSKDRFDCHNNRCIEDKEEDW